MQGQDPFFILRPTEVRIGHRNVQGSLAGWMDRLRAQGLEEVLGRLSFASMPLGSIRPFLGSLYAWVSAAPLYANLKIPASARLTIMNLLKVFCDSSLFMQRIWTPTEHQRLAYLGDAHASTDAIGIGGYEADKELPESKWFCYELTPSNARWAYQHGTETYRSIAALKLTLHYCV